MKPTATHSTQSGQSDEHASAFEKEVVKLDPRRRDYMPGRLDAGPLPRSEINSSPPLAAPRPPSGPELAVPSDFWCGTRIEVPAELTRSNFSAPKLQAMTKAAALDLAAIHRPQSVTNRFSAACFAIYSAARLLLAHLGFRVSERVRRDVAMFEGVKVFGFGTALSELVDRVHLLREQYHAALFSKLGEISSEQATNALRIAESFHSEVTSLLLKSVEVPVATSEELISGEKPRGLREAALKIPLPLLHTTLLSTRGRWVALRVRHPSPYRSEKHLAEDWEESFAVVHVHGALPYVASEDDYVEVTSYLVRRRKALHLAAVDIGIWQHSPNLTVGEPVDDDITVLGEVVCVLRHMPVKAPATKRRASSRVL